MEIRSSAVVRAAKRKERRRGASLPNSPRTRSHVSAGNVDPLGKFIRVQDNEVCNLERCTVRFAGRRGNEGKRQEKRKKEKKKEYNETSNRRISNVVSSCERAGVVRGNSVTWTHELAREL